MSARSVLPALAAVLVLALPQQVRLRTETGHGEDVGRLLAVLGDSGRAGDVDLDCDRDVRMLAEAYPRVFAPLRDVTPLRQGRRGTGRRDWCSPGYQRVTGCGSLVPGDSGTRRTVGSTDDFCGYEAVCLIREVRTLLSAFPVRVTSGADATRASCRVVVPPPRPAPVRRSLVTP